MSVTPLWLQHLQGKAVILNILDDLISSVVDTKNNSFEVEASKATPERNVSVASRIIFNSLDIRYKANRAEGDNLGKAYKTGRDNSRTAIMQGCKPKPPVNTEQLTCWAKSSTCGILIG